MSTRNHIYAVAFSDSSTTTSGATWAILVVPKKVTKWFRVGSPSAVVYGSHGKINDARDDSFLIKILIGENAIPAIDSEVQTSLRNLAPSDSASWLQGAVRALQFSGLVTNFDVGEFVTTAYKALSNRQAGQDHEVIEIDHEGRQIRRASAGLEEKIAAIKHKEKKQGGMGFWISQNPNVSYGHPRRLQQRNSWERQDDAYGGLM